MSNKIEVFKTDKNDIPQPKSAKQGVLCNYPASYILIGKSGSGKTNILLHMLKNMHKDFFHYIVYFSPTGQVDDLITKTLNLPKNNIITEFDEDDVNKIINAQKELIEKKGIKWVAKNSRVALVFDDIIQNQKFLRSQTMTKLTTLLRHYLISVFILSQYYKKLSPVCRTNANGIILFPSNQQEVDKVAEEMCPANMSSKDFKKIIKHATKEKYNFLFINNHAEHGKKLRKNFNKILTLDEDNK